MIAVRTHLSTGRCMHQQLRYSSTVEYYSATKRERTFDTGNNVDEPPMHSAEWKKSDEKATSCVIPFTFPGALKEHSQRGRGFAPAARKVDGGAAPTASETCGCGVNRVSAGVEPGGLRAGDDVDVVLSLEPLPVKKTLASPPLHTFQDFHARGGGGVP